MSAFTEHLAAILEIEGGDKYTDRAADAGGPTRYGITEATAREYGYTGHMRDLPLDLATAIYRDLCWEPIEGDQIDTLDGRLAYKMLDIAVHLGAYRASVFLQRCLNVFNRQQHLYRDTEVDGIIGPATLHALGQYLGTRRAATLVQALTCLQGAFYVNLAEKRQFDEENVYGWIERRIYEFK